MLDYITIQKKVNKTEDIFICEIYEQGYDMIIDDSPLGYIKLIDSKNNYEKKIDYKKWLNSIKNCKLIPTSKEHRDKFNRKTSFIISVRNKESKQAYTNFINLIKKEI